MSAVGRLRNQSYQWGAFAPNIPSYVDVISLVADTPQTYTFPANAKIAVFYSPIVFYIKTGSTYTLDYDAQSANFTVGDVLTGGTSTATARIVGDVDGGATGTLTLTDIVGTFQNDETITDEGTGSATSDGVVTTAAAVAEVPTATVSYGVASLPSPQQLWVYDVSTMSIISASAGFVHLAIYGE